MGADADSALTILIRLLGETVGATNRSAWIDGPWLPISTNSTCTTNPGENLFFQGNPVTITHLIQ